MIDTVPAHLSRPAHVRPGILARLGLLGIFLLTCALAPAALAASASAPYVETKPDTGFHLFLRPARRNPADQLLYIRVLLQQRDYRAATRQARALRLFWPDSPQAPKAQFVAARLLDRRGKFMDAFDAYQILIENYPESCDYDAVCAAQLRLANTIYTSKLATCWGLLPGFSAPERAIPLYEKLLASAPEGPSAPEAAYRIACAREANYDYDEAINAFYQVLNRFPESPYAVDAALGQARCHIALADDAPLDARAREAAIAACDLVLSSHSSSIRRAPIERDRRRLLARREEAAYERCLYYDRTLRDPAAALLEYRSFVALFPASDHLSAAQARIRALEKKLPPGSNPLLASAAPAESTP